MGTPVTTPRSTRRVLRLPPLKLFEAGSLNTSVWRIVERNVRVPDKVLGDLRSQISALAQGEKELLRLAREYGFDPLLGHMANIVDHTERLTRAEIRELPDGSWEFTDYIDTDGLDPDPIAIRVRITIDGDEMEVDFTGTSPQARGSINPNFAFTRSTVYAVFKCLTDPGINANAGFFKPIHVVAPEGCFVNPRHPGAVAARGLGGFRVGHAVFGAFAKALPHRVPAAWGGGDVGVSIGGYHPDGKPFVYLEFNNDGPRGGGPSADGADGVTAPITNMANTPVETFEADQPDPDPALRICNRFRGDRGSTAAVWEWSGSTSCWLRKRRSRCGRTGRDSFPGATRAGARGLPPAIRSIPPRKPGLCLPSSCFA